jgi:hypothetical protein
MVQVVLEKLPPGEFEIFSTADNPDTDGKFRIFWSSSPRAKSYELYQNNTLVETIQAGQELSVNIHILVNGNYQYRVIAKNDFGETESDIKNVMVELSANKNDGGDDFFNQLTEFLSANGTTIVIVVAGGVVIAVIFKMKGGKGKFKIIKDTASGSTGGSFDDKFFDSEF